MSGMLDSLNRFRYPLLIAIALLLLCSGINSYSLRGSTEPREAGVAAEMLQDGDYIVPRLNGEKFLEKPTLSYWLQAASLRAFGYQPFAARLPSILAGVLCVCLMFFAVEKLLSSKELAWCAALLLLTMASFWMNARIAGQDILLTLGVAITLFGFYFAHSCSLPKNAEQKRWWLLYTAGVFVATFTKGVIGAVLPGFVIAVFLGIDAAVFKRGWRVGDWLRPLLFAVIGILPLALWLFVLYRQQGIGDVNTLLWANSFERFSGSYTHGAHSEPFYYYLQKLPETFAPWNVLLFVALWQLRKHIPRERNLAFFCCWLIAPYLLLSLSAGKRPTYLLMIYPAAAVLITLCVQQVRERRIVVASWLWWFYTVLFGAGGVFVCVAAWREHMRIVAAVFAVLLVPLFLLLIGALRAQAQQRFAALAFALLAITLTGYGGALLRHDKDAESLQSVFAYLRGLEGQGHTVILLQPIERVAGAARFYLRHGVAQSDEAGQVQAALQRDSTAVALVAAEEVEALHGCRVLADFLDQKRKYVVVAGALPP